MDLAGKSVLVTGAAHGIGRATAEAFVAEGASVTLVDIDGAAVKEFGSELSASGKRAFAYEADVTSEEAVGAMIDAAIAEFGSLDVLVNNAGVTVSGPAEETPVADWQWALDINVWPHIYAVRKVLPYFKSRGSGHLVHVASAAGILGTPGLPAYSVTKFAVYGLAESLAVSLHGTGIGVSVVCPLWVDTDITNRGRLTPDPAMGLDERTLKLLGREMLRAQGLPAAKVAEAIVEGVRTGRFLILSHPEVLKFAQSKWEDPERYITRAAEVLNAQRRLFGDPS